MTVITYGVATVISRLVWTLQPWTYALLGLGSTATAQVYVSEDVACSGKISSMILYIPAENLMVVLLGLPPGPLRLPFTSMPLSTTAGSIRMVQVRARKSPG